MNTISLSHYDLQWILRRTPEPVLEAIKAKPNAIFLAGGFIRSCVANEPINDLDLFVPSKEDAGTLAMLLADNDPSRLHKTDNAITIKGWKTPIQVIHRWTFDNPVSAITSFDFTIAMAAVYFDQQKDGFAGIAHEEFYADLAAKRIVYTFPERDEEAGGSLLRILKFYQRGYRSPLNTIGGVIARIMRGVDKDAVYGGAKLSFENGDHPTMEIAQERQLAKVLTGLLREVDPNVDPTHAAHLPDLES